MNIDLSYLRYFFEVARQGSFMGASRALRISQPGISKIIRKLESECDVVLFQRTKKGVVLTDEGALFLSACERIYSETKNLGEEIQKKKKSYSSEIRLGVSDNLGNYILPEVMSRFLNINPKAKMKVFSGRASDITREILEDHVDFGMFYNRPSRRNLEALQVAQIRFSIVVGGKVPLKTWRQLPFVGLKTTYSDNPYVTIGLLKSIGITPESIHEVNNQEAQKRIVLKGIGYAVLPTFMVEEEIASKHLREINLARDLQSPLYLVQKVGKKLPLAAADFKRSLELETYRIARN